MKGYVQEPETSDFKTEGWGEGAQALRTVGWAKRICLLLPKSLISCKMASRNNINLSSFLETVNSERTGATRGARTLFKTIEYRFE